MTHEELAMRLVKEAAADLKARWKEEAVGYPLTPEGDVDRRLAAYKSQHVDDLLRQIELKLKV